MMALVVFTMASVVFATRCAASQRGRKVLQTVFDAALRVGGYLRLCAGGEEQVGGEVLAGRHLFVDMIGRHHQVVHALVMFFIENVHCMSLTLVMKLSRVFHLGLQFSMLAMHVGLHLRDVVFRYTVGMANSTVHAGDVRSVVAIAVTCHAVQAVLMVTMTVTVVTSMTLNFDVRL